MILDALGTAAIALISFITYPLTLLGDVQAPANANATVHAIQQGLSVVWELFPTFTAAVLAGLSFMFGIEVVIALYKGISWLIKKIPGIN